MEPLSSFGISIAAGVALNFYNELQDTVKKEIEKAFEKALVSWCRNSDIRERRRSEIKKALERFIAEPELITDLESIDSELNSFFKKFDEAIAEKPIAYNYIKEVKDLERFRVEVSFLSSIKNTVEDTNRKLTDLIEDNLPVKSDILEGEWQRQLRVYKESISSFKPKTALNLLLELEESFVTNSVETPKNILSYIEFLKGQCYELIGKTKKMYNSYIKANRLNSGAISFKEKACYSYAKIGEKEKSKNMIDEILKYDEYNSVAWAVKIILAEGENLESHILETPKMVRTDWNFRRLVYLNTLNDTDFEHQMRIFEKHEFLNESYDEEPLTLANYEKALYIIEITLSKLLRISFAELTQKRPNYIDFVTKTNKILGHFIKEISSSEISSNYKTVEFYYYYSEFLLRENRESVLKMRFIYEQIKEHSVFLLMTLAYSLQLIDEIDEAMAIINKQEAKPIEAISLEAFCYLKKSDIENYIRVSKVLLKTITKIDLNSSENILSIPVTLHINNRINDIEVADFLTDKEFETEELKQLFTSIIHILKEEKIEENIKVLQSIENEILKLDYSINFYIPYSYFVLEKWNLAIASFRKYISKEKESRDLFFYILALDKSLSDNEELLELLESWRNNFQFNDDLLRIEADLCRQLPDWDRCLIISDKYLSKHPSDESFLVLKLIAINKIVKTKEVDELAEIFKTFDFKQYNNARNVSIVLIENMFYQIALDILYKNAIGPNNIQARMDYFYATTQMPEGIIQDKEIVELGSYVKYSINNETKFLKIVRGNPLAEKMLGQKVGYTVIVERPMVKVVDDVKILRIMDKYLCLHDEILEDIKSDPHSGFPMQSFELKDTSPEGLNKTFVKLFGAEGTIQKDKRADIFKNYYNLNLSFTEIVTQIYDSDYIGGYFNLINYKDGITLPPMIYYPEDILTNKTEIVLDFSSLLILYQISREHNIKFEHKLLIAKGVVEYIRSFLKKVELEPKEKMSLSVTSAGVNVGVVSEDDTKHNIIYLRRLLEWIESSCSETIVTSKLDLIRKLEGEQRNIVNTVAINLIIENYSLVMEKENRILLTDDFMYFKLIPIESKKTMSSELYVKSIDYGNDGCYIEFMKNK